VLIGLGALVVIIVAISATAGLGGGNTVIYSSAQAVVAALGHGGLPCTGAEYGTPVVKGATSETLCDFSSSDQGLIDVFPRTHIVTTAEVLANSVSTGDQKIWTVYGPNWWVQTDSSYDHRVQKILGGKILGGPWNPGASTSNAPSPALPSTSPSQSDPAITVCQEFDSIYGQLSTDLNAVASAPSAISSQVSSTLNHDGDEMAHWSYVVNQAVDNGTTSASVQFANDLGDAGLATVQSAFTQSAAADPSVIQSAITDVETVNTDCSALNG
jgi:hypothetical protein